MTEPGASRFEPFTKDELDVLADGLTAAPSDPAENELVSARRSVAHTLLDEVYAEIERRTLS